MYKTYYLKFNNKRKKNGLYRYSVNGKDPNNEVFTYVHKKLNENKILSNKNINSKKMAIHHKLKILNKNKNNTENLDLNNSCELEDNKQNKKDKIKTNDIIANINKITISSYHSITIDMNILNQNNMKYLKFYDSIKNKLI